MKAAIARLYVLAMAMVAKATDMKSIHENTGIDHRTARCSAAGKQGNEGNEGNFDTKDKPYSMSTSVASMIFGNLKCKTAFSATAQVWFRSVRTGAP
ncbi:MAG: hypothetical protein P1V21_13420 [Rhizobiaceae bacterium]|nr:hypothetical protein [Rhizobiaceae bacterium]